MGNFLWCIQTVQQQQTYMIDSIKVSYAISFSSSKLEKTNKQIYGFLISLYLIKPFLKVLSDCSWCHLFWFNCNNKRMLKIAEICEIFGALNRAEDQILILLTHGVKGKKQLLYIPCLSAFTPTTFVNGFSYILLYHSRSFDSGVYRPLDKIFLVYNTDAFLAFGEILPWSTKFLDTFCSQNYPNT